jgi:propanol-preferring alcohol dehydrogenase
VVNAANEDPVAAVQRAIQGAYGVLVTPVSRPAFAQGVSTLALVGLPPGDFDLNIFEVVLTRKTVRGSIVGTWQDLVERLAFAAAGQVKVHYQCDRLENINQVLANLSAGRINGRVVLDFSL